MQKEILVSENPIVREASEGVVLRVLANLKNGRIEDALVGFAEEWPTRSENHSAELGVCLNVGPWVESYVFVGITKASNGLTGSRTEMRVAAEVRGTVEEAYVQVHRENVLGMLLRTSGGEYFKRIFVYF
ncbi:MAG TPA: hypothetical protein VF749_09860 [Candidatus Acidoferrum sp.]